MSFPSRLSRGLLVRRATLAAAAMFSAATPVVIVSAVAPATASAAATASITSLDPSEVFTVGNDLVFVAGTGLSTVTGITVDGTKVDYADEGDGTLSFFTPAHELGKAQVRLVTTGGTTTDNGTVDDLTYVAPPPVPVIESVTPNSGPFAGGNTVTIKGQHLLGALGVVFGDFALGGDLVAVNDTTLTVVVPEAQSAGKVDVLVINAGGSNGDTPADDYTYGPGPTTPVVTSPPPSTPVVTSPPPTTPRPPAAGEQIALTYQCSYPLIGEAPLRLDIAAAIPASVKLGVPTPPYDVTATITGSGYTFDFYNLIGATRIAGSAVIGASDVLPGALALPFTVPAPIDSYDVPVDRQDVVLTAAGAIPPQTFTRAGTAIVTIDSVRFSLKAIKANGDPIIFPGAEADSDGDQRTFDVTCRLDPATQDTSLTAFTITTGPIFTTPRPTSPRPTSPIATSPIATSPIATSPKPTSPKPTTPASISALDPSQVYTTGNDLVFVSGTGLDAVTAITVDGVPVSFADEGDGSLSFFTPEHAVGTAQVRLVTASGTSPDNGTIDDLTYVLPPPRPVVESITPSSGPLSGGNSVTIRGQHFEQAIGVVFGDFSLANDLVVVNDTTLTVSVPAGPPPGKTDVLVINAGGISDNTPADDYTYGPAPTTPYPTTPVATTPDPTTPAPTTPRPTTPASPGGKLLLTYQCTYPLIGDAPLTVQLDAELPATAPVGVRTPPSEIVAKITASGNTSRGFDVIGAVRVDGAAKLGTTAFLPGDVTLPITVPLALAGVDLPATDEVLVFDTSGAIPALTFPQPGTAIVTVDSIALSLRAQRADGTYIVFPGSDEDSDSDPNSFDVTCRLEPATQNTSLAAITITGGVPSTTPIVTTPQGTTPKPTTPRPTTPIKTTPTPTTPVGPGTATAEITKLDPREVFTVGNDLVFVEGTGLSTVTGITVDGAPVDFADEGDGTLSFFTPEHAPGIAQVRLVTAAGITADNGTIDDLVYASVPAAPVVTSVTPNSGPLAGGNTLTIKGQNLATAVGVIFGDFSLGENVKIVNDTTITVTAPPGESYGKVDVLVVNPGGSNENTAADDYTYAAAPAPTDTTKPVVTIGAVTQSAKVGYRSSLTVAVMVSEPSKVSATLSRHEYGVIKPGSKNCVEVPKTPPAGPALKRCVRVVWTNPVPSKWISSGSGALVFEKAPKPGWWTLAVQARDKAGNTGGAKQYVLIK